MSFEQIEVQGVTHFYREMFIKQSTIDMWKREVRTNRRIMEICKVCHKEINEPCYMYLLINNNKVFPNCWAHKECFESLSIPSIIYNISNEYHEALKYEHWFR